MAVTLYYRNTATHVGTLGTTGNFDLETTTGTTATQAFSANTPRTYVYYSATSFPNKTDWDTGDYTYYVDITTANANVQLTSVKVSRYDSSLTTEKASGTATPNLTLSTTGVKTGTISFASPNPGNRADTDRLVVTITFSKLAGGGAQSVNADVNGSADSRIDTPLVIPIVRNVSEGSVSVSDSVATQELYVKPISEDSVSVSENLDDTETYVKPISEGSVSVSGSVERTFIPGEEEGALYDVHFVEFPEDVSESLLATKLAAGEQVTKTGTHKFDVIGKVTKSTTHKYNVIEQITKSTTHKYNLLHQITKTTTHLYNLLQQITRTRTHKYNIIAQIQNTKTHKYHVEGIVSTTKTHKYNLLNSVTKTTTHKYNILQAVTKTTTHKYNVIGFVTTTKTHKYHVEGKVTTTKTHKFNILEKITTTKTHKYNVQEGLTQVTKTVTHKFNIVATVQKTTTHKYNLLQQIAKTATHKYNIIEKITRTRTHLYTLLNAVSRTRTHKYNILQLIQRTRTHKYNVDGTISTTKTHRYQMGGKVVVTKTHRYQVGLAFVPTELGGSTNAYVRFPERIKVIDIIADIENRVVANVEIITSKPPPHKAIALVAIAEYASKFGALTAGVHKPRHRIASSLIVPQVIDTIENRAIAPYIGIEELPLSQDRQFQTRSHISLHQKSPKIHVSSLTQIREDGKPKIKIASATALQQSPETAITTSGNLQIPYNLSNGLILTEEIMTKRRAQTLKTLIDLLKSNDLFE